MFLTQDTYADLWVSCQNDLNDCEHIADDLRLILELPKQLLVGWFVLRVPIIILLLLLVFLLQRVQFRILLSYPRRFNLILQMLNSEASLDFWLVAEVANQLNLVQQPMH